MTRLRLFVLLCLASLLFAYAALAAPVKLSTVTVSPGSVTGGASATGTATLTAAAGHNGVTVTLSSSNASVAAVPASVFVAQGATSATFPVTTTPVAAQTSVTITGNYQATATASFTVVPPTLTAFSIDPPEVMAIKQTAAGTLTLNGVAPAGGLTVALSSSSSAATLPASMPVFAGESSSNFGIGTNGVASQTTAIVTATLGGNSRVATLTVDPCTMSRAGQPAVPAADIVWLDDTLPSGMSQGSAAWDTAQAASGSQSLKVANAAGAHGATLSGATATLTPNTGEHLVAYLLLSDCTPPREIVLSWHAAGGAWSSAYYGQTLLGGESGYVSLGGIPSQATWIRVDIPASQLGLENVAVDGFQVQLYDGQVWFDRLSKTCAAPFATPPAQITDTVWIDDTLPAGASTGFVWDTAQHALGTKSLHFTQTYFNNQGTLASNTSFWVGIGETLNFWVLLDSCDPPSGLRLDWLTPDPWTSGTASWGTTNAGYHVGAMPAVGVWTRLSVPARTLGLEQRTINYIAATTPSGSMWFDAVGKSGTECITAFAAPPSIPAGDTVLVDDATPSGGSITGSWDAGQHASGTQAIKGQYSATGQHDVGVSGFSASIPYGLNLVVYVLLNDCDPPPSELAVEWTTNFSLTSGVYWGTPSNWSEQALLKSAGTPMPAQGSWQRIEIPSRFLGLENTTITSVRVCMQGAGQAWIDHVATSGTPCSLGTATPPTFPSGDTIWVDDPPVGGATSLTWDTSRVASGTKAIVEGFAGTGTGWGQVDEIAPPGVDSLQSTDKIVLYMLVNECAPPSEIQLRFGLWSGDVKNAYWGTPHNMSEQLYMGPVPAGGSWVRVEIPASALNIIPGTYSGSVTSLFFFVVDGQAWFDRIGKSQ